MGNKTSSIKQGKACLEQTERDSFGTYKLGLLFPTKSKQEHWESIIDQPKLSDIDQYDGDDDDPDDNDYDFDDDDDDDC